MVTGFNWEIIGEIFSNICIDCLSDRKVDYCLFVCLFRFLETDMVFTFNIGVQGVSMYTLSLDVCVLQK